MTGPTAPQRRLTLIFDPLCGWCYGATPAIHRVSQLGLELLPAGLFAGQGARAMSREFAQYAWANDQRIAELTGQRFSERYREQVLGNTSATLDSSAATLALTAVALHEPARELAALEAIQAARYVEGRDVTEPQMLISVLRALGLEAAAAQVQAHPAELVTATRARMTAGRALLQSVGGSGVPTLVLHQGAATHVVPSDLLFTRDDRLLRHLSSMFPRQENHP